ncbi:hypothetical protein ACHAXR_010544 [Thalassiosira sp. AJA248-18]
MFTAKSYNLGLSGTLVEMNIPTSSTMSSSSSPSATPIIILDQSGSMGQWATRYPAIISDALIQAGFSDKKAEFITFASHSAHSTTTVLGLRNKGIESSGATYMSGAIEKVRQLVTSNPGEDVQLIVVSDGDVHDIPRALDTAEALRKECAGRTGTIDASLVRLVTSSYGSPDTRAVSCLGQLSATRVDVLDLDGCTGFSDAMRSDMVQKIKETLRGCLKSHVKFNLPVLSVASFTGDGGRVTNLAFNEGRHYVMVPHDVDMSNLVVEWEGQSFTVESHTGSFGEENIMVFLRFLESKMRMLAVVGTSSSQQSLKQISDWLSGVENALASMRANGDETKKEDESTDYTLASRKKVVMAKILKSQKGIINSLKHLANIDAVAGLNSQQKANFLRGVTNNKSGRGLAKRAAKSAEESTPDELAVDGVKNLARASIPMHEEQTATKSFYSHATAPESLELAAELADLLEEGASAVDILQLIGIPGIPFMAYKSNYVDPWSFRVDTVFPFDSSILSQSDLWHSMNTAGGPGSLRPPGFDTAITGVDPVRSPNPETYDTFIKNATGINQLHASVSMRGLIAPVPGDEHALKTAVTLNLVHVCANSGGTESSIEKLRWEMEDMATLPINKTIREHMVAEEPGAYFTGDLGIGNVMRLYSALLGWKGINAKVHRKQKQRILRDMYSFAVYHKLKQIDDRDEAIQRLLGLDMEGNGTHLTPVNESNTSDPVHCSELRLDEAVTKTFNVLSPAEGALVMRVRELADEGDSLAKLSEGVNIEDSYGLEDEETWTVAIMIQALKCMKASYRVDTTEGARRLLIENFTSNEQCRSYLSTVARDMYKADYEKRLLQKTAEEAKIRMMKLVEDINKSDSMQKFLELMEQIPNRSAGAFGLVLEALVASSDPPLRFRKMWVCLLGRNMEGDPCWNDGNCLVGDLSKYNDVFHEAGETKMWKKLVDVRAKFPLHQYRDLPNRHGHSNDFPSFYYWGYESLDKFKEGVDDATFREYCAAHAKRGCCGLST